jgi:hypothetical protein
MRFGRALNCPTGFFISFHFLNIPGGSRGKKLTEKKSHGNDLKYIQIDSVLSADSIYDICLISKRIFHPKIISYRSKNIEIGRQVPVLDQMGYTRHRIFNSK